MPSFTGLVRFASRPDGGVCLNVETGDLFSVDAVGADICAAVTLGLSREAIVDRLAARFPETDVAVLVRDVDAFLQRLSGWGLLCWESK